MVHSVQLVSRPADLAKGVPWKLERLGMSSDTGTLAVLQIAPCASCKKPTVKLEGSSSPPLDAIAFSLLFSEGFITPFWYDRSCEDGCHHLETLQRQGLYFSLHLSGGFLRLEDQFT